MTDPLLDQEEEGFPLFISSDDLDVAARGKIEARLRGDRHLQGGDEDARQALFDAMPAAVGKRVKAICPPEFDVAELSMKMAVKGSPFGIGIEGEVVVIFRPRV